MNRETSSILLSPERELHSADDENFTDVGQGDQSDRTRLHEDLTVQIHGEMVRCSHYLAEEEQGSGENNDAIPTEEQGRAHICDSLAEEGSIHNYEGAGRSTEALKMPTVFEEVEEEKFELDVMKRSSLILNWQAVTALLTACGTVRFTAVQFEMFRSFVNWGTGRRDLFVEGIPSYSKLQNVLVRCCASIAGRSLFL
jgi:hypothetical protein